MTLFDASKLALGGASVTVSNTTAAGISTIQATGTASGVTDANGNITLNQALPPGEYTLLIDINGVQSTVKIKVDSSNGITSIKVITPLADDGSGNYTDISSTAIIASISGIVQDSNGDPVEGATVALSGGTDTNGSVATAITNKDGVYQLLINVNQNLQTAMLNASVIISKPGYDTHTLTGFQVIDESVTTGLNFVLQQASASSGQYLFEETFESDSTTLSGWTTDFNNHYGTEVTPSNTANAWHVHTSGLNIINDAYTNGWVDLAGDDQSAGAVPNPDQGSSCYWFGDPAQGNFLGTDGGYNSAGGGGYSTSASAGSLISPQIDLTSVAAGTPLSLIFDTWWEIESVNPNAGGFDLMQIMVKTSTDTSWTMLARLNPLSDPVDDINRAPIPYSNMGYNNAPAWVQQEPIPLDGYQGKTIQIKFVFETVDWLYNGFRGWLIDDVRISTVQGSFPVDSTTMSSASGIQKTPNAPSINWKPTRK